MRDKEQGGGGGGRNAYSVLMGNLRGKDPLEETGMFGRIIL